MKKYFAYVPPWAALAAAVVLENLGSAASFFAYLFFTGFRDIPSGADIVKGVFIMLMAAAVTAALMYGLFALFRKFGKEQEISSGKARIFGILTLCILLLPPIVFFIVPDYTAFLYLWWA
ncbi:MAG: hypothetical protein IJ806_10170 [Ruminococcus sp.]|nr:hypothetical protein [Ruminococcus sp.]